MEKGTRVGAVASIKNGIVQLFGYGTYQGREVPPPEIRFMGISLYELNQSNPKILLDNGDVVWGCECYWAEEREMQKRIALQEVKLITVKEYRGL